VRGHACAAGGTWGDRRVRAWGHACEHLGTHMCQGMGVDTRDTRVHTCGDGYGQGDTRVKTWGRVCAGTRVWVRGHACAGTCVGPQVTCVQGHVCEELVDTRVQGRGGHACAGTCV